MKWMVGRKERGYCEYSAMLGAALPCVLIIACNLLERGDGRRKKWKERGANSTGWRDRKNGDIRLVNE